jgi:hypothetical protein
MLPFEDRYSRQRRLVEVGPEGQRWLGQSSISVADHEGVHIERDYLVRAGVARVEIDPAAQPVELPWAEQFEFSAPLTVARGAYAALFRIRAALPSFRR